MQQRDIVKQQKIAFFSIKLYVVTTYVKKNKSAKKMKVPPLHIKNWPGLKYLKIYITYIIHTLMIRLSI